MVRLGKVVPQVWENLEKQGISQKEFDEALEEAEKLSVKAAELTKEAISKAADIDWKSTADAAKEARELSQKYGIFKDVVMSEWFRRLLRVWRRLKRVQLLGEPRMSPTTIVVLLYMLLKAQQPLHVLILVAAFMFNVHPLLILAAAAGVVLWSRQRKPKGFDPAQRAPVRATADAEPLSEEASKARIPEEVDHIVLGSDIGALYAAALLSRIGHRVLVLEPEGSLGNCTVTHRGIDFDWGNHTVGMVQTYDAILKAAVLPGAPAIDWVKIGTEADGFAFDVATVGHLGDVVYRAGKAALVDDQVVTAPDNRDGITSFVTKAEAVAREAHHFFVSRLFNPSAGGLIQWSGGTNYAQAGRRTVSSVASVLLPILPELDHLRGVFRLENLGLEELSFGAYVSALNHAFEGMCYPRRGYAAVAAAFVPTVRAAGGAVLTKAPVKSITLSADGKSAVGVKLESGEAVRCRKSVISGLGVVPTYTQLLPKTVALPDGVELLREAKPRLYTAVVLRGTPEELDLPSTDYYYVPTEASGGDWMRVSFPCAKDPTWSERSPEFCSCVVETELDDDLLELCLREKGGEPSPGAAANNAGTPGRKAQAEEKREKKGLQYYRSKVYNDTSKRKLQALLLRRLTELFPQLEGRVEEQATFGPVRAGLSHTPARFAAQGLRPCTPIAGLYLAGKDLSIGSFAGGVQGGWLAAHAVLGYGGVDLMLFQRNLIVDIENLPKK